MDKKKHISIIVTVVGVILISTLIIAIRSRATMHNGWQAASDEVPSASLEPSYAGSRVFSYVLPEQMTNCYVLAEVSTRSFTLFSEDAIIFQYEGKALQRLPTLEILKINETYQGRKLYLQYPDCSRGTRGAKAIWVGNISEVCSAYLHTHLWQTIFGGFGILAGMFLLIYSLIFRMNIGVHDRSVTLLALLCIVYGIGFETDSMLFAVAHDNYSINSLINGVLYLAAFILD